MRQELSKLIADRICQLLIDPEDKSLDLVGNEVSERITLEVAIKQDNERSSYTFYIDHTIIERRK